MRTIKVISDYTDEFRKVKLENNISAEEFITAISGMYKEGMVIKCTNPRCTIEKGDNMPDGDITVVIKLPKTDAGK